MITSIDTALALPEGVEPPAEGCATWTEFESALRTCGEYHYYEDVNGLWACELYVPVEQYHRARAIVYWLPNAYIRIDVIPLIL
jgi:hypothetical protein